MTLRQPLLILSLSLACAASSPACQSPNTGSTIHSHEGQLHQDAVAIVRDSLKGQSDTLPLRALAIATRHNTRDFDDAAQLLLEHEQLQIAGAAALYLQQPDLQVREQAIASLRSPNPTIRASMIRGISRVMGESARTLVLPGLQDESAKVRRAVVSAIIRYGNPSDYAILLKTANSDPSPQVRARALRGLRAQPGQNLESLIARSLQDDYLGTRLAAISLLDSWGGKDSTERLQALAVPGDFPAAIRAAVALHKRKGVDSSVLLLAAIQSTDWEVRASALNAAAQCTDKKQAKAIASQASSDTHAGVKLAAARLHRRLGNTAEGNTLFHRVLSTGTLPDRLSAATELASHGDSVALQLLSRLSLQGSPAQRNAAIYAQASARIVSEGLLASLRDPNPEIRLSAAEALLSQ